MGNIEEDGENSIGGEDDIDEDEFRTQRDRNAVADGSGFDMDIDLGNQETDRRGQHDSASLSRNSGRRPSFQHDVIERDLRERVLKQHDASLSNPSNDSRQPYFIPPELSIREQRGATYRSGSTANPERNSDNSYMDPELSRSTYHQQPRTAAEPYQSQSLAERDAHLRRDSQRDLMSHRLEDGDANRAQGEMFSRLDILVAAAAEPVNDQRDNQQAGARISAGDFMSEHEVPIPSQRMTETGGSYSKSHCRAMRIALTCLLDRPQSRICCPIDIRCHGHTRRHERRPAKLESAIIVPAKQPQQFLDSGSLYRIYSQFELWVTTGRLGF